MSTHLLKEVINLIKEFDRSNKTFNKDIDGFKEWVSNGFEKENFIEKENFLLDNESNNLNFSEKDFYILFLIKMGNKNLVKDFISLNYQETIEKLKNEKFIREYKNQIILTTKGNNFLYKDLKIIFNL